MDPLFNPYRGRYTNDGRGWVLSGIGQIRTPKPAKPDTALTPPVLDRPKEVI